MLQEKLINKEIRSIKIGPSKVFVSFVGVVDAEPIEGQEESQVIDTVYTVKSKHKPHKDLVNSLKKLLPHALKVGEFNLSDKNPAQHYTITQLDIAGDLYMDQSRVTMIIGHEVERTGKIISIDVGQVTLSEESDYKEWESLKKLIEKVVEEAWEYFGGKHEGDQLKLAFDFSVRESMEEEPAQLSIAKN